MNINCFSVTFWFNIFDNHNELLSIFQSELKEDFKEFKVYDYEDNLLLPIIYAVNDKKMYSMSFSQINFQFFMENVSLNDYDIFKEKVMILFNILKDNGVDICHTSLFINGDKEDESALKTISNKTITSKLINEDLIDMKLKLGIKCEDLYYKIITIMNKKQVELVQKTYEDGRIVPIPLVSWIDKKSEKNLIDISYEINDKYSFDYTKNYKTTEFYLNKMLFILYNSFEDDVNNIIKKGKI